MMAYRSDNSENFDLSLELLYKRIFSLGGISLPSPSCGISLYDGGGGLYPAILLPSPLVAVLCNNSIPTGTIPFQNKQEVVWFVFLVIFPSSYETKSLHFITLYLINIRMKKEVLCFPSLLGEDFFA